MLVDINLLPRKEPKNLSIIFMITFVLFSSVTSGVLFYLQYKHVQSNIQTLQTKLEQTKAEHLELEQNLSNYVESDALKELDQIIQWAEKDKIYTVPLLKKLTMLLPERGFITKLEYDNGNITVDVQFDTTREAAYYLKALTDDEFIENVTLLKIISSTLDEAEQEQIEQALPRYIATYEIVLNQKALRQKEKGGVN
jgi:type IV pilus assembly protein PilN